MFQYSIASLVLASPILSMTEESKYFTYKKQRNCQILTKYVPVGKKIYR